MADSVVYVAVQHIESRIKEGSGALVKVKSAAIDLLSELKNVNKLLAGAEGRTELSRSHKDCSWVGDLTRIAYEAEDEVDTLASASSSSSTFISLNFGPHQASKKLRELKEQTRVVKTLLDKHAQGSNGEHMSPASGTQAPKDKLPADGELVIGIEQEITRVVDQLTAKSKSNDGQPPVARLAIVGMGGSGKTTLARSVYNHRAVKKQFNFQAWVSVSQGCDTTIMLRDMLKQIRGQNFFFALADKDGQVVDDPNKLVTLLNNLLCKKTCLLVLDDVWDLQSLHKFIALIQGDNYESITYSIVITSRRNPLNYSNWCIHQTQWLTQEHSWKLFSMVASNSSKPISVEYRNLAMVFLRKCQGLPLAIVALARRLRTKDSKREWPKMLSQIEGEEGTTIYGPVKETLGLSYDELPCYLKPCFLYLGLFPEGSTITGGALIRMWIAEGFIRNEHLSDGKETLEVAGRRYLQELIDHTMVQVVEKTCSGKAKFIRIHVIMRDFCILKARELDFLAVSSSGPETIGTTSRRAAIYSSECSNNLILPASSSHIRSIVLFGLSCTTVIQENHTRTSEVNQILNLDQICQMYKLLRVLDIVGIKSPDGTLPKEIGNLIHLTYLRIRSTNIQELPKSIGKLRNLLTLEYRDALVGTEIQVPNVLSKLEKLRHLYLPDEMSGSVEALKLDSLKDLITLWGVGGGYWMLKEMGKLSSTITKLYIHGISTEDQLKAVLRYPATTEHGCLYALALNWYGFEFNVFDKLISKIGLQRLKLMGEAPDKSYVQGYEFPSNLRKLELHYTQLERPETMALLGRHVFLKVLILSKDSYIGIEWSCNEEAFPVLEELTLAKLPNLETWEIQKNAFRCLKKLSIVSCIRLKRMPEGLKFVRSLEKFHIKLMPGNFSSRLLKVEGKEQGGEDFHIIKHIAPFTCSNPLHY